MTCVALTTSLRDTPPPMVPSSKWSGRCSFTAKTRVQIPLGLPRGIAQMVEHMSEEHGVGGSIPPSSAWVAARYEKHFRGYGGESSYLTYS